MSAVWEFFTLDSPTSKTAKCKVCAKDIPRGGTKVANFNTSNLISHLEKKHAKEYAAFVENKKKQGPQQQSIEASLIARQKYPIESPQAKTTTQFLVEMIVLDDQPLQLVENIGFRRFVNHLEPKYPMPSRHHVTDKSLPMLYEKVKEYVADQINKAEAVSFTTDIWSSSVSPVSMISLTAHWVDTSTFTLKSAVLHATEFRGSHTANAIGEKVREMFARWKITMDKFHVVLRDNASNMRKAFEDMQAASLGCFAHSLQLVVKEGLLSQRSVKDALAKARGIIGHFKHSPLATSRFEDIQRELGATETKRLLQDVATRWNSSFYMIQSMLELRRAISSYGTEHELPSTLTANEWALLEKVAHVLEPFEEVTKKISLSTSTAAEVIPHVSSLKIALAEETPEDTGIKTMKTTLLESVQKRFEHVEKEPLYAVATLLDARFKDRYVHFPSNKQYVI